jgi:hypothetical protein
VTVTHSILSVGRRYGKRSICRAIVAFGLSALCVTHVFAQKITTEFDESVDFSKVKTFAVRDGRLNSRSPALNSELTKKRIQSEIERALTAKGLTPSTERSDLNVFYTFGAQRRVETETYPAGWRGLGTRVARVPYAEGTLVIDLRDPTTKSLVWRGIATEEESDPAKLSDKLDDMIKKSVARYPPRK